MVKVKTYDEIMSEYKYKLASDMDTREGSFAHILMSATALSMAELYEELKLLEDDAYAATATGDALDRTVEMLGMERMGKSKSVVKIEADGEILAGDIFTGGDLEYKTVAVHDGYYLAECTTAGSVGNTYVGEVLPKKDSESVSANITEIVALGRDKESDEELRKRYIERLRCPMCTGNVSYYKDAIHSISGVGGIKIEPVAEGAGTVKVIITSDEHAAASDGLVSYVKEYLDPEETSGLGYGVVPIGHRVTVESAQAVDIDVNVEINGDANNSGFLLLARSYLPDVLRELNKTWDENDRIVIWDRIIEDFFFTYDGVEDVNVVSINGESNRLFLKPNQVIGEVTVNGS